MIIALLGYGKMGHEVEKIALESGHTIGLTIDNENEWLEKAGLLSTCDVAIEFSLPVIAVGNIKRCFKAGIPIVVGTTGWYDQFQLICDECSTVNGTLFHASNYSIGVNIFFELNSRLASALSDYPMYQPSMTETHHTQKLDSPSGTAISLAKDIISANPRFTNYTQAEPGPNEIPVQSVREGSVTGIHSVTWSSETDLITITHEARSRRGFAVGAVMAASWVQKRKGVFTMKDMLNL